VVLARRRSEHRALRVQLAVQASQGQRQVPGVERLHPEQEAVQDCRLVPEQRELQARQVPVEACSHPEPGRELQRRRPEQRERRHWTDQESLASAGLQRPELAVG
jgi:hypothetical protein